MVSVPSTMKAMVLEEQGKPLIEKELPVPEPEPHQLLVKILCCGVCRTDLHIYDGELQEPSLPLIPGHEIIGEVVTAGSAVSGFETGRRVGVPWLGHVCGDCFYCRIGKENLCDDAEFTGYQINGGYAEYTVADAHFCFPVSEAMDYAHAAPLMCAGLIGYRSYRMITTQADKIGFYGFGAAAHILVQVAFHQGKQVYAFTRPGDKVGQRFAREKGVVWAGDSTQEPPEKLDAAIIFAPVGPLVPAALKAVRKGGQVISAGIHMSDIPEFPYHLLWEERTIQSVANLTRQDGEEFLSLAPDIPIETDITKYPLSEANQALEDLRNGKFSGAAVLMND